LTKKRKTLSKRGGVGLHVRAKEKSNKKEAKSRELQYFQSHCCHCREGVKNV
jgi:hypothetical protein